MGSMINMPVELRELKYRIDSKLYQYLKEHETPGPTPPGPTPPTPSGGLDELADLINQAIQSGERLVLDQNYQFVADEEKGYIDSIPIDGVIEIDGNGHTIDLISPDGKHAALFHLVGADSALTLKNTTVVNGSEAKLVSSYYVIDGENNITVDSCTFINCEDVAGIINGATSVTNCTFMNNTCRYNIMQLGNGTNQQIKKNLFMQNTLTDYESGSGGIIVDAMADEYTIESNVFLDNSPNKVRLDMYGDVINNYWGTNHVTENSINLSQYPDYRAFSYESLIINYPAAMLRVPEAITIRFTNTDLPEFDVLVGVVGNASLDTGSVVLGGLNPSELMITPLGAGVAVFTLGTNLSEPIDVHEFSTQ